MTEILTPPVSVAETADPTTGATDESLIHAARELNASYHGHLRRSIEDFWRLGQTLSHLFQRRHLQGRWSDVLSEIGINVTTDNHARRLYRDTTIEGLAEFKNKTAALRALGILPTPKPSAKVRGLSSLDQSGEYTGAHREEQISVDHEEAGRTRTRDDVRPERRIVPSEKRQATEPLQAPNETEGDRTPPSGRQPIVKGTYDSLEVLAKIAARLEYLAADRIDVTADHLTQIDRMFRALEVIRSKGVVDAA